MKRYFLIVAAVALATVSCSRHYDVNPVSGETDAIGFGTWANVLTRARANASDNTAFQTGDVFDVFGYKTVGSTNSVVFNGDNVTATVSGSSVTWDYETHRFWDPSAVSYTFYAVLPAGNLKDEDTANYWTDGKFVSNDISFADPTNMSNDILVSNEEVVDGVSSGTGAPYSYANPVRIKFNHIASCVNLYVKQDKKLGTTTTDPVVKVTALSLLNIKNNGKYEVKSYASHVPSVEWKAPDATATYLSNGEYVILSASDASDDVTAAGKTTYANDHSASATTGLDANGLAAKIFSDYVFMPQDITADVQQIKLSYTIQVGSETPNVYTDVVIDIRDFMTTDTDNNSGSQITSWAPGTKYIYTITIGANAIEFTASVNAWNATTVNGYQHLIN